MNSRLKKILTDRGGQIEDKTFLDDYNQTIYKEFAPTITTRIIECCHYFIYEEHKAIECSKE